MYKLIENIVSYLEYLNTACRLSVSVHFRSERLRYLPISLWQKISPYNKHTNPYCMAVKANGRYAECILSQTELYDGCENRDGFCRVCHAGVYEYIRPIIESGQSIGFVAVSGFRKKGETAGIVNEKIWKTALKEEEIPFALCETVVPPLCVMLEKLFSYRTENTDDEQLLMLQFLNEYHTNITFSDFCKHFGRSKSYVSHTFKSRYGVSFREYCNNLKIEDAKRLLLCTDSPVTEIAFDVGYNDVSYFIQLFRKKTGVAPLQYRKLHTAKK